MDQLAIVGGGVAGLTAGFYAVLSGYKAVIYERRRQMGGLASWWGRGRHLIDGGVNWIMYREDSELSRMCNDLGVMTSGVTTLNKFTHYVDGPSGEEIVVTRDLGALERRLLQISPEDGGLIRGLIAGATSLGELPDMPRMPPELTSFKMTLKEMFSMGLRIRWIILSPWKESVGRVATQNPIIWRFLCSLFGPEVPLFYIMGMLATFSRGRMHTLSRGLKPVVQAMEARYLALGGKIERGATVESITFCDRRPTGIALSQGERRSANAVIWAGNSRNALFGRPLGSGAMAGRNLGRMQDAEVQLPILLLSYGLSSPMAGVAGDEPEFWHIWLREPLVGSFGRVELLRVRHSTPRRGYPVLQVMTNSSYDLWHGLQDSDREAYEAAKVAASDAILAALNRHFPGVSDLVVVKDVATPHTFERYTANSRGSYRGYALTPQNINLKFPRTLPDVFNVVLAGQWVAGGGFSTSVLSGLHAVRILCNVVGRRFTIQPPPGLEDVEAGGDEEDDAEL